METPKQERKKQIDHYMSSDHKRGEKILTHEMRQWIMEQRALYRDKMEVVQELEDKFGAKITIMAFNRYWNLECADRLIQYHNDIRKRWLNNLDEEYLAQTRNQIRELTKMYNDIMGDTQYEFELEDVKLFEKDGKTPLKIGGKIAKGKALVVRVDNAGRKKMAAYQMCMDILNQIANLAHLYKVDVRLMQIKVEMTEKDKQDLNSIDDLDFTEYEDITEEEKKDDVY